MQLGHAGYLETCRRALVYCLRLNGIAFTDEEVRELMQAWQRLTPHADVAEGLRRLKPRFKLVALSNGEQPTWSTSSGSACASASMRSSRCSGRASSSRIPAVYRAGAMALGVGAAPAS